MSGQAVYLRGFSRETEKLLVSRGVPGQDLPQKRTKINVADVLVKMEPSIPNVPQRTISAVKQLKAVASVLDHPLRPYTLGISSFPSDQRAKHLALEIMYAAIEAHKKLKRTGKGLPLWHRVFGGYQDQLRDKPLQDAPPCMLIITNLTYDSTQLKIEKVRDLLEKFHDIPRIVVSGGNPPCDLFANKLFFPMKAGFYLGPDNVIQQRDV